MNTQQPPPVSSQQLNQAVLGWGGEQLKYLGFSNLPFMSYLWESTESIERKAHSSILLGIPSISEVRCETTTT